MLNKDGHIVITDFGLSKSIRPDQVRIRCTHNVKNGPWIYVYVHSTWYLIKNQLERHSPMVVILPIEVGSHSRLFKSKTQDLKHLHVTYM